MKKLSRLKTSLFSLPLVFAAIVLVFISSDSDKNIVKGVFTGVTQIAHADGGGSTTEDCTFDCSHPGTTIDDCVTDVEVGPAGPDESY